MQFSKWFHMEVMLVFFIKLEFKTSGFECSLDQCDENLMAYFATFKYSCLIVLVGLTLKCQRMENLMLTV